MKINLIGIEFKFRLQLNKFKLIVLFSIIAEHFVKNKGCIIIIPVDSFTFIWVCINHTFPFLDLYSDGYIFNTVWSGILIITYLSIIKNILSSIYKLYCNVLFVPELLRHKYCISMFKKQEKSCSRRWGPGHLSPHQYNRKSLTHLT